jgi:PAS domain S-box-containing protein
LQKRRKGTTVSSDATRDSEERAGDSDVARVMLFMESGRNRELLAETLGDSYDVETTTEVEALDSSFDCCVFDTAEFNRVAGAIQSRRETSDPLFLPFVLLVPDGAGGRSVADAWQYVDDVIELPVDRRALLTRIGNLVERRRTAARLAEREAELRQTVEDLSLKERAMDEAPVGITITEGGDGDNPLVYVNEEFEALTGYGSAVLGEDCRILQGPGTDETTRAKIREAIDAERPVSVDILNYRRNGRKFWNRLEIAPVRDDDGTVEKYVGFQTDITERKIRERRLEVMNRVLSHNLRNKMNVIEGYSELLREDTDADPVALARIDEATEDLMGLAEAVRKIDVTLSTSEETAGELRLDERLENVVNALEERYPDASVTLTTPGEPIVVSAPGLVTAIEEAIENAIKHNDAPEPRVEVTATVDDGWVTVEVRDNGPGVPEREVRVLREGETALNHADRLGLWLMYWAVSKAGGEFDVREADPGGTVVTLSVPTE